MRKIAILILLFTLSSCGYNVKTDRELKQYQYKVESVETMLDEAMDQMKAERDSLRIESLRSKQQLERFKDSIAYMELSRVACYTTGEHRHSCVEYK